MANDLVEDSVFSRLAVRRGFGRSCSDSVIFLLTLLTFHLLSDALVPLDFNEIGQLTSEHGLLRAVRRELDHLRGRIAQ